MAETSEFAGSFWQCAFAWMVGDAWPSFFAADSVVGNLRGLAETAIEAMKVCRRDESEATAYIPAPNT